VIRSPYASPSCRISPANKIPLTGPSANFNSLSDFWGLSLRLRRRPRQLFHMWRLPAQPFRMMGGRIEVFRGLEQLVMSARRRLLGLFQQCCYLIFAHRTKATRRLECLLENLLAVDACNYN